MFLNESSGFNIFDKNQNNQLQNEQCSFFGFRQKY